MKHIIFKANPGNKYSTALLIKDSQLKKQELEKHYVNKLSIPESDIIAFDLEYQPSNKAPATLSKQYLNKLLKGLSSLDTQTLLVCDSSYFKYLTGEKKVTGALGGVYDCNVKGYEHMKVIYSPSYAAAFYNPKIIDNIQMSLNTLESHLQGAHKPLGTGIIHSHQFYESVPEISSNLSKLHKYPVLTCDIETTSLKHYDTEITTIAFAWDEHNGVVFNLNFKTFGSFKQLKCKYQELKKFFDTYKGKLIFHNANYDLKVIIRNLYMNDNFDTQGMIKGIQNFRDKIHDTKIIAYLATNTTAGNQLSLKELAHEFAGNYAEDVTDISSLSTEKLLTYNLKDCLATWYVYKKYFPIMQQDNQQAVYDDIFLPSISTILQMELSGIPISISAVQQAETQLINALRIAKNNVSKNPYVKAYGALNQLLTWKKFNEDWKVKTENIDWFSDYDDFNPHSNKQLKTILHDIIGLPIFKWTPTGEPAVGAKVLKSLKNHTKDLLVLNLLDNLIEINKTSKILNTFISAFKKNSIYNSNDGMHYLFGNFNLGGTVSGRLSSSGPNLQNIPSGSTYAKLIKKCFVAPRGYIMAGADFDSLEDRISALTTGDPNKLKVYTDGYDGHCLRAYAYFKDKMPDIKNTVESINSIEHKYPKLRQASKTPTFALTYGGTAYAIMDQAGIPKQEALEIERNYHQLYQVSDKWVADKLEQASKKGYVEVAFGLRVRTPILAQTILNKKSTPKEAEQESRTAGNALGQSYGLLNNRAANEFQERVLASPYALDIKPIMQIHDSMYFIIKNKLEVVKWVNDNLPECMAWDKLSELQHESVKLSGSVELFYPNWATVTKLPNNATKEEIIKICQRQQI